MLASVSAYAEPPPAAKSEPPVNGPGQDWRPIWKTDKGVDIYADANSVRHERNFWYLTEASSEGISFQLRIDCGHSTISLKFQGTDWFPEMLIKPLEQTQAGALYSALCGSAT